jgi:uncharacterized membrane protein YedE/YeeE
MVASMNDRTWTQACADCCLAAVVVAAAVGLLLAAALAAAPPAVLPLVVLAGVGMPMVVAYGLPPGSRRFAPTAGLRPQCAAIWRSFPRPRTRSTGDAAWQIRRRAAGRRPVT